MVKAGSFNIGSQLEFNSADELPIVLKAKLPKLVLGPLEVGLLGEYQATGSTVKGTGVLAPIRLSHIIRIKVGVSGAYAGRVHPGCYAQCCLMST